MILKQTNEDATAVGGRFSGKKQGTGAPVDEWPTDQPWHTETHLNHPVRRERNYSGNVGDLSQDFVHRPE
ncbi:MAG: hypothetical protein VX528_13335, partial [Candidatus Latescibacterota bacterium]|nr:hypothetical protein [Candidatus Latescibacterota bacterium]